jgi:hypothetical protein
MAQVLSEEPRDVLMLDISAMLKIIDSRKS